MIVVSSGFFSGIPFLKIVHKHSRQDNIHVKHTKIVPKNTKFIGFLVLLSTIIFMNNITNLTNSMSEEYDAGDIWGALGDVDGEYEDTPVMDHSAHAGHGGHGGHAGHSMAMNFHGNHEGVIFLFESMVITTKNHLALYTLLTFAMGILIEFIKDFRIQNTCAKINANSKNYKSLHLKDSALHLVQTTIGYFLMLIAMTFHYILFSAAMLGMATGFYIFNKVDKPDDSDVENDKLVKGNLKEKCITQDSCGC